MLFSQSFDIPDAKPGCCYEKCKQQIIDYGDNCVLSEMPVPLLFGKSNKSLFILNISPDEEFNFYKRFKDLAIIIPNYPFEIDIVLDTNIIKSFSIEKMEVLTCPYKLGFTEWEEIVCDNKVNSTIIKQLKLALINLGYPLDERNELFDISTKKALKAFQESRNLPIGFLNKKTLAVLGIND
jgi:hypothetical protein